MLAAAARPDLVRTLTLVEPCAHTAATADPAVAGSMEDGKRFMASARTSPAEDYAALVYGDSWPSPREWAVRAAATALGERPCWLADLPLEPLAQADFPKQVILGAWDPMPPGYRPGMAHTMRAVSTTVADRIGATLLRIPGAAHEPQREAAESFNAALADIWARA